MTSHLINFDTLFTNNNAESLLSRLLELEKQVLKKDTKIETVEVKLKKHLESSKFQDSKGSKTGTLEKLAYQTDYFSEAQPEKVTTDRLISLFDILFNTKNVQLVRGKHDPEYFPADNNSPARVEFAHGFFSSALHELSHWCIAGSKRRELPDFGYWYAPDGRSAFQQHAFERLEIKPQALECLFTLACGRKFQVSQDNLFANFDTNESTFSKDVYQQAASYINQPQYIPSDAKTLLQALLFIDTIKYPLRNIK